MNFAHNLWEKIMRTSAGLRESLGVVSEEENDDDKEELVLPRQRQPYWSLNWFSRLWWLTRIGQNGNWLPPVGQFCLILKGEADTDVGRMGVVNQQMKCMVSVIWRDERTGETREKLKHPNLLIQLEDRLMMEHDTDGMLWVVRQDMVEQM
jgi:hypothetical protein